MISKMKSSISARRRGFWFTTKTGQHIYVEENETPKEACERVYKEKSEERKENGVVKVDMVSEFQKEFDTASPKERQKLAFDYIMDHLRGEYEATDGRMVSIERVGADKMTHIHHEPKLRATPMLAEFVKRGEYLGEIPIEHKKFYKMAYYKISFSLGDDVYEAKLNVGIRKNGLCTLYDLNPFNKM